MLAIASVVAILVILGVLGSLGKMFGAIYDWRLWPIIRRAKRGISAVIKQRNLNAEVFVSQGATAINPRYLSFGIRTRTDKERDALRQDPEIYKEFCDLLLTVGYPQAAIPFVHFGIESQETVDRDYGGSWWEAGQMP